MFDLEAYFSRLGLSEVSGGADGLCQVQTAQMRAVPFENVTPLLGEVPPLDLKTLTAKLLRGGRGGYCYEQNTLLQAALTALCYAPRRHLARVRNGAAEGGARSHLTLTVEVDGVRWLVDAGFGGHSPLAPVRLAPGEVQTAPNGTYRIDRDGEEWVLFRRVGQRWQSLYGFDEVPVRDADVQAANFLSARWDQAPFPHNLMVAFYAPSGRVALFNRRLTRDNDNAAVIADRAALRSVLTQDIGLTLTDPQIAQIWARIEAAPLSR